jgi:hypothetical protein
MELLLSDQGSGLHAPELFVDHLTQLGRQGVEGRIDFLRQKQRVIRPVVHDD